MRKISVYIVFFVFLLGLGFWASGISKVFASAPAPAPKCNVEGLIKDVRYEKAYESECLKTNSCPTDTQTKFPDLYYLTIKIEKVSYKDGDTNFQTCDGLFPINSIKEFNITASSLREGDILKNDQKIKGVVSSFWGHSFDSYQISSTTPLTPQIGGPSPSIFDKAKSFFDRILNTVLNFINGVKSVETTTKNNY